MKKIVALALVFVLMLGLAPVHAAEQGKYDLLTVGITTPFSGNFLDDALGSNISDQDVRNLIHGYNLVTWDAAQGSYEFNQPMVTGGTSSEDGRTYTFHEYFKVSAKPTITVKGFTRNKATVANSARTTTACGCCRM